MAAIVRKMTLILPIEQALFSMHGSEDAALFLVHVVWLDVKDFLSKKKPQKVL